MTKKQKLGVSLLWTTLLAIILVPALWGVVAFWALVFMYVFTTFIVFVMGLIVND